MKHHAFSFLVLLLAVGLVCGMVVWTTPAHADNLYASIRGTVVDPTGAVVPDAKLTATNLATGLSYSTTSTKDGLFAFLQLPIGDYSVKVEKSGFKTLTEGHIHLDLDQIYALNAKLDIGAAAEVVEVEANPAQVETTSMQLGTTVTGTQIVELPLNGRNWTQLMQLQPGVQGASDRFGTGTTGGGFSTNGAETQQNSFLINGNDTNDTSVNTPLVIPSPDAIGEFDLVSSTLNPEYGRNSGAIVNAIIKNGTNQFHGDVFEFYRDTFLDAIPWFETSRALFHQNQYGGTIGGPIIKDHAFFFFSYQGRRAITPQPAALGDNYGGLNFGQDQPIVFTQAERNGDLSAAGSFYTPPGPNSPNPEPAGSPCGANYTGPFGPSPLPFAVGTATAGTPWCVAFPSGVIPNPAGAGNPNPNLNPLSVKLVNQYVPLPNGPGNGFFFNPLEIAKRDQYLGRLDEKLSSKDSIWFYGLYDNHITNDNLSFDGSNLPGLGAGSPSKTYEYTTAWNHTFSPTMLNEARFAFLRFNYDALVPLTTQSASAYGFTGISSTQAPAFSQLPVMFVSGLFSLGFSAGAPQPRLQNTYQLVDNLSKVWGHHTFKAGFNMDRLEINNPFYNDLNGLYQFFGSGSFSTGNAGADFLLGIPDTYQQGSGAIIRARGREYYSYGQDQWQVKPNLTLTLGAGWDVDTPFKNLYAGGEVLGAFHPGQQSTVFPTAPVGLVFPGDKGVGPYGDASIHYDEFAPRFGFAWSPGNSQKWSVRGGIGLYFNRTDSEATLQTLTNVPFSTTSIGGGAIPGSTPGFANPFNTVNPAPVGAIASGTTNNPFPFTAPAPGSSPNFAQFEPIGINDVFYSPHLTSPRSTNFNLNLQYQVSKSTVATVAYVGAIGRHLEGAYNMNPAGQASGNPVAVAEGATNDFNLPALAANTYQFNPNVYGGIGLYATGWNSNYNSLQAQINRHFNNGLQFQAAYTWSRDFDFTSSLEGNAFNNPGFNALNFARNYGPSANDAPQRLVVNYVYTLPLYKYSHHWKQVTDGWNLSGIGTFQHGFPVGVFQTNFNDLQGSPSQQFFASPDFVNATGAPLNINHNPRTTIVVNGNAEQQPWVNPAAFAVPLLGTQGTANRNPFYGPGLNYWDMALEKSVHLTESMYFQLRFETFNTFNHANFGAPVNNFSSPAFGQINTVQQISTNGAGRVVQLGGKFFF